MPDNDDELTVGIGPVEVPDFMKPQYSNYVSVNHTPWDFRLTFALVKHPLPGPEEEKVKQTRSLETTAVADIMIPASLIHGLIAALNSNFDTYLKKFGPPGLDPRGPSGIEG